MRSRPGWDLADPPPPIPDSLGTSGHWVSSPPPRASLLVQERSPLEQKFEPTTCYELQEQWLLVKQNYNAWQPRCLACPSGDRQKLSRVRETVVSPVASDLETPSWQNGQFPAFEWCLLATPTGSQSRLTDTDTLTPCLILDQPGQYRVRFVIGSEANRRSDRLDVTAVPAIISDLTITACDSGSAVAIALADFTVKNAQIQEEQESYLFLVAVYAGLTYL